MPINPQHYGAFSIKDYSNETSHMNFNFGAVTVGNLVAFLNDFGALRSAVEGIILGALVRDKWVGDATKYNAAIPTDVNAQRERKWLVVYQGDTTFAEYKMEIPTADFAGRLLPGTDLADLTDTDMALFVTNFEVLARTPEGEAVEVLYIQAVGRNL